MAVVGPFLGVFLDKIGHRVTMTNMSCILLIITQVFDMYAPDCNECSYPIIILVNQGICSCFQYALSFGTIIAFTVEPNMLGRGFGVNSSFNNIL